LSLAAILLCGGLIHAAPASPAKKSADDDKIMTITDGGKTHRCQILRSYKNPSGGIAYEVKDLETGEVMTVIEKESATKTVAGSSAAKPAASDPIMQPKQFNGSQKVQQQLGVEQSKDSKSTKCDGKTCKAEAKLNQTPT